MRRHDHSGVAGNHDLASIGKLSLEEFNRHAAGANRWTATQLTDEHVAYLGGLELKLELDEFTIVHGSPRDPVWEYVASVDTAVANFSHFDTSRCLVGHTHIPFICRQVGDDRAIFLRFSLDAPVKLSTHRLIINPGGVGQPRDGDPRASYAVYDSESQAVVHHRVDYDIPATQQKMRQHGLPKFLIERLVYGH